MRKLFVVLWLLPVMTYGQDTLKKEYWRYGIGITGFYAAYNEFNPVVGTCVAITNRFHFISAGVGRVMGQNWDHSLDLNFNYRYTPFPSGKDLNFYFSFLLDFNFNHRSESSLIANGGGTKYYDESENNQGIFFGYGLDMRIFKRVHLSQFVGIGGFMNEFTENAVTIGTTGRDPYTFKSYNDGIGVLITAALSFDIFSKNK